MPHARDIREEVTVMDSRYIHTMVGGHASQKIGQTLDATWRGMAWHRR